MKTKLIVLSILMILGLGTKCFAEDKIAYANLEAILAYMPDIKGVQDELRKLDASLSQGITAKKQELQTKLEAAQKAYDSKAPEADLKKMQDELGKMDGDIKAQTAEAQKQLVRKRSELMTPISKKVQDALADVAKEKGYTYIINGSDGTGMSVILQGPDDRDVTKDVLTKLGVDMTPQKDAAAPAVAPKDAPAKK